MAWRVGMYQVFFILTGGGSGIFMFDPDWAESLRLNVKYYLAVTSLLCWPCSAYARDHFFIKPTLLFRLSPAFSSCDIFYNTVLQQSFSITRNLWEVAFLLHISKSSKYYMLQHRFCFDFWSLTSLNSGWSCLLY